jgi:predicted MFS family arabinose efflux permease
MIFPSMGVEVVRRVSPQMRGTAMGGFAAFQDLAYGATGPLTGLLAEWAGDGAIFMVGSMAGLGGLLLSARLAWHERAAVAAD